MEPETPRATSDDKIIFWWRNPAFISIFGPTRTKIKAKEITSSRSFGHQEVEESKAFIRRRQ